MVDTSISEVNLCTVKVETIENSELTFNEEVELAIELLTWNYLQLLFIC